MIFGSTYLEDYWELVVHIDTAEASGRVLHANHVSNKFLSELKYNLWGDISAKNMKIRVISTRISISRGDTDIGSPANQSTSTPRVNSSSWHQFRMLLTAARARGNGVLKNY